MALIDEGNLDDVLDFPSQRHQASGIFTWVIATDVVYADSAAAESFGFDAEQGRNGLPLKNYLARMHPEDLPHVAKAIQHAMATGLPYQEEYRVTRPDGSCVEVMAFGSCFRDNTGQPSQYAGMIVPVEEPQLTDDALLHQCLTAYTTAKRQGKHGIAQKLIDVLAAMECESCESDDVMKKSARH